MLTDIEIAQQANMKKIREVAEGIGISEDEIENYGPYMAKFSDEYLKKIEGNPFGKLILVTAINPTPAGEGKTTVTIGLGDALTRAGKKTMIALREPSLGPCFGIKGGAAGGGGLELRDEVDAVAAARDEAAIRHRLALGLVHEHDDAAGAVVHVEAHAVAVLERARIVADLAGEADHAEVHRGLDVADADERGLAGPGHEPEQDEADRGEQDGGPAEGDEAHALLDLRPAVGAFRGGADEAAALRAGHLVGLGLVPGQRPGPGRGVVVRFHGVNCSTSRGKRSNGRAFARGGGVVESEA